jgi:hypothetical protein
MATVVPATEKGHEITISEISADWAWSSYWASGSALTTGIYIKAIKFFPGAAGDKLLVTDTTDAGAVISFIQSSDGEPRVDTAWANLPEKPYIDFSGCTLSAGHKVTIMYTKSQAK